MAEEFAGSTLQSVCSKDNGAVRVDSCFFALGQEAWPPSPTQSQEQFGNAKALRATMSLHRGAGRYPALVRHNQEIVKAAAAAMLCEKRMSLAYTTFYMCN